VDRLDNNKSHEEVQAFINKLIKISLALLLNSRGKQDLLKGRIILALLERLADLTNDPERLVILLVHTHKEIHKQRGQTSPGLIKILARFGDV
jgi:hypothetical protein